MTTLLVTCRKTAIYTRLALADDERISEQERRLLEYAEAKGYSECACYRDNGQSGVSLIRPELVRLIADVESGAVGAVIVQDLARLSRDYWQLDELVSLMTANDVLLISTADSGAVNGAKYCLGIIDLAQSTTSKRAAHNH
jgi:DNA invertase Pin-like site-specific DNA recombinase